MAKGTLQMSSLSSRWHRKSEVGENVANAAEQIANVEPGLKWHLQEKGETPLETSPRFDTIEVRERGFNLIQLDSTTKLTKS